MTEDLDLELLRRLRPSTAGPDSSLVRRERNALMAVIQQAPESTPSPERRRRRSPWKVPAIVFVLGATTAAGWAVASREAHDHVSFACVASDGDVTSVLPNDGTSPVEACAREWASGAMVPGVTTAPPLTACVFSGEAVTVIEGTGAHACEAAGMAPWEDLSDFEAVGRAVRSSRIAFHDRFAATGNGCATDADWREVLGAQLEAEGTGGWAIEADQVEPDRRCYDVGEINPFRRTIVLIGVPDDHSIGCDPRTGC